MRIVFFIFFFFIILYNSNYIKAKEVILFVDSVLILNTSLVGKSINNQLKEINSTNVKRFEKTENDLKLKESQLLSQKNILIESEYMEKVSDFKIKVKEFNNNKKNAVIEFNKKKREAELALSNILTDVLSDYAKKNSISLILSKQSILLGKNESDITETIINTLNLKIKTINIK
jgi:Skp family chaperone for outer membrane proteins